MAIVEPLPESVRTELSKLDGHEEEPRLAVSTDIDGGGRFGVRWLVATKDHAYVFLPDGDKAQVLHAVPLREISEVNAEFLVGSGVLEVGVKGQVIDLLHYTHSLAPRFTKVARILESLAKDEEVPADDTDEDKRCETCGRLLPDGSKVCPACLNKTKVLKRLLGLTRPYWGRLCVLELLMLLTIVIGLAIPYLNKPFWDNLFGRKVALPFLLHIPGQSRRVDTLVTIVLVYVVIWLVSWGAAILQGRRTAWLASRLTLDVRVQLYQTLQRLSLSYFDKRQIGSIMARVTQDTSALNSFMNNILNSYVGGALLLLGTCWMMFQMSWQLALWVLVPSPLVAVLSMLYFKKMMRQYHRFWHSWSPPCCTTLSRASA